jgi:hypothetical protein
VRNISLPPRNDIGDYQTAIANRPILTRTVLESYIPAITVAYTAYTGAAVNVITLTPMTLVNPDHSSFLESNYDALSPRRALQELAAELHEAAGFRCPMCNFEQTSTLDHFLPRSTYPEFSILARNLIAACFTCNNRKGSYPASRFVHAYLDGIPGLLIVVANTIWDPELHLRYSLIRPNDLALDLFTRLSDQFQLLGLADRFEREAGYVLTEIILNCEALFRRGGANLVRDELLRQAHDSQVSYGINHYKPAMLRALSADTRFCSGGFRVDPV